MTHTSSFFLAIATNNEAVHHFEAQDYNSAARCLAKSLRVVKQALKEASDVKCSQIVLTEPVLVTSYSMSTHSLQGASNCMPFSYYTPHHKEDISSALPEEESIYVYGYASLISTNGLVHCNDTCLTVSAIIVYHLALLYHLQALKFQEVSEASGTYLRKALRLYERSYLLHMSEASSNDHQQWSMGLLNNLAHVNHTLNDQLKANQYWQMLLSLIVYVRGFHYSDDQGYATMREEEAMVGFLTNVTRRMLKNAVSAPAA
jgi:hypothetical protein